MKPTRQGFYPSGVAWRPDYASSSLYHLDQHTPRDQVILFIYPLQGAAPENTGTLGTLSLAVFFLPCIKYQPERKLSSFPRNIFSKGPFKTEAETLSEEIFSGKLYSYSHSIVPGGLEVMSYITRLTPGTSSTILRERRSRTWYGKRYHRAVMASRLVTARIITGYA